MLRILLILVGLYLLFNGAVLVGLILISIGALMHN